MPNGHLKVQVEPGEWQIQLTGRALGAPTTFRATPETDNWPAEEIWGFNADRALRVVNVEGATPIDLSQTNAPFEDVPAYVVTATNELKLVEQFRGDPNPVAHRLFAGAQHLAFVRRRELHRPRHARRRNRPSRLVCRRGSYPVA